MQPETAAASGGPFWSWQIEANPLGFLVILGLPPCAFLFPHFASKEEGTREWVAEGVQVQPGLAWVQSGCAPGYRTASVDTEGNEVTPGVFFGLRSSTSLFHTPG